MNEEFMEEIFGPSKQDIIFVGGRYVFKQQDTKTDTEIQNKLNHLRKIYEGKNKILKRRIERTGQKSKERIELNKEMYWLQESYMMKFLEIKHPLRVKVMKEMLAKDTVEYVARNRIKCQ